MRYLWLAVEAEQEGFLQEQMELPCLGASPALLR